MTEPIKIHREEEEILESYLFAKQTTIPYEAGIVFTTLSGRLKMYSEEFSVSIKKGKCASEPFKKYIGTASIMLDARPFEAVELMRRFPLNGYERHGKY